MEENGQTIRVISIADDTVVDGPGFRTSIYCAGCENACPGCHNKGTWDPQAGHDMTVEEVFNHIVGDEFANVTFTGGDPFLRPQGFATLAARLKKETGKNIWCYTGYLFEDLLKRDGALDLLKNIDVLVDGPFRQELRDETLLFRGSSNQRLIDAKKSIEAGRAVEYIYDPYLHDSLK